MSGRFIPHRSGHAMLVERTVAHNVSGFVSSTTASHFAGTINKSAGSINFAPHHARQYGINDYVSYTGDAAYTATYSSTANTCGVVVAALQPSTRPSSGFLYSYDMNIRVNHQSSDCVIPFVATAASLPALNSNDILTIRAFLPYTALAAPSTKITIFSCSGELVKIDVGADVGNLAVLFGAVLLPSTSGTNTSYAWCWSINARRYVQPLNFYDPLG